MLDRELRQIAFTEFEVREDGGTPHLRGYASVFNTEAVIAGLWREQVAPGAYRKTVQEADIRALWNHDTSLVLGRNKAGTLRLAEDDKGLRVDITPPDTQAGRDAVTSIKRGDVSQMSIAFSVVKQEWTAPANQTDLPLRTIREARLYEVSPVTFPAFETTSISARSSLFTMAEAGYPLTDEQRETLRQVLEPGNHSSSEPGPTHSQRAARLREIELQLRS
jgi:HK97 family phage prohead protease